MPKCASRSRAMARRTPDSNAAGVFRVDVDHHAPLVPLVETASERAQAQYGSAPFILGEGARLAGVDHGIRTESQRRRRLCHQGAQTLHALNRQQRQREGVERSAVLLDAADALAQGGGP